MRAATTRTLHAGKLTLHADSAIVSGNIDVKLGNLVVDLKTALDIPLDATWTVNDGALDIDVGMPSTVGSVTSKGIELIAKDDVSLFAAQSWTSATGNVKVESKSVNGHVKINTCVTTQDPAAGMGNFVVLNKGGTCGFATREVGGGEATTDHKGVGIAAESVNHHTPTMGTYNYQATLSGETTVHCKSISSTDSLIMISDDDITITGAWTVRDNVLVKSKKKVTVNNDLTALTGYIELVGTWGGVALGSGRVLRANTHMIVRSLSSSLSFALFMISWIVSVHERGSRALRTSTVRTCMPRM